MTSKGGLTSTPLSSDKGHKPSDLIQSEILATCGGLGSLEDDVYHKDPDCVECLKDLIRFLRNDNDTHEVRRTLGDINVLQTDLLPILSQFHDDDLLFDVTLRLLVNITNPALLLYKEELPEEKVTRNYYLEIVSSLEKYKRAFADSKVWEVLTGKMKTLLEKDPDNHDEDDKLMMERILILIRNVVNISSSSVDEMRTDDDVCLHDQVIWAINVSGMADLLIYIAANENEQQFCFHVIEIISQILREQTPSQLATAGEGRTSLEKKQDMDELSKIRAREQATKSKLMKNYSRHPRFGVTFQLKNVTSISDRDVICHKFPANLDRVDFDSSKLKRRTPKNRRPMVDQESNRRSTLSVRRFLRNFCVDFLDNAYNTFMGVLKDHLTRGRAQDHDDTYYLWAVSYFMEFNRLYNFDVSRISETLSIPMFHYIHTQIETYYERLVAEKKNLKMATRWSKRMHLGLKAYREVLMTLATMDAHSERDIQESAKVMKGNIFYTGEYRDLLHHLIVVYDPVKFPRSYLKDLVEAVHVFVRMLEQYCKSHSKVIVQKKDKKKKKRSRKSKNTQDISPEEQLQRLWDDIADEIARALQSNEKIEGVSPFDATLDLTEEKQKSLALVKIQTSMREKRVGESVTLLRVSRELWPTGEVFGTTDVLTEQEFILLREIFFTKLEGAPEFPPKEPQDEDSESESDDEDEMASVRISEQEFNFFDFIKRFASPKVAQPYAYLLANYEKNEEFTNKALLKMMHRIAWDLKMHGLFFQASLFRTFQKILDDPNRHTHSSVKELGRFALFIVGKFFEVSSKNKKAFMELLFWKNTKEVYEIQEGYGSMDPNEAGGGKCKWSDEQDAQLKVLYEDFQKLEDPEKDVIDYIADSFIDSSKTHRQILRRLKVLDIVKRKPKPTRVPKEWSEEEMTQLRSLFDQYKSSTDILARILENLSVVRSKARVVDKLLELGLVSDRKELRKKRVSKKKRLAANEDDDDVSDSSRKKPKSKKTKKKKQHSRQGLEGLEDIVESDSDSEKSDRSSTDEESDNEPDGATNKARAVHTAAPLDMNKLIEILRAVIEADLKTAVSWIRLSLETTVEDLEEEDGEPEAVPLVPIVEAHYSAMELPIFRQLLVALGLCPPSSHEERFWRIPAHLSVYQLKSRIQVLEKAERGQLLTDINARTNDHQDGSFSQQMTIASNETSTSDNQNVSSSISKKRKKIQIQSDSEDDDNDNDNLVIDEDSSSTKTPEPKRKKIITDDSSCSEPESPKRFANILSSDSETETKRILPKTKKRIIIQDSDSDSENDALGSKASGDGTQNVIPMGLDSEMREVVSVPGDRDANDDETPIGSFTRANEVEEEENSKYKDDELSAISSTGLEIPAKPVAVEAVSIDVDSDFDDDDEKNVTRPRKIRLIQSDDDE